MWYSFIFLDLSKLNDSSWSNTIAIIDFLNEHFTADFDWFVTAHVDTHVQIEKLREFLMEFNQNDLQYFDYAWLGLLRTGHEGGYILSRASVSWLASKGMHNSSQCSDEYFESERIRACMRNIGVYSGIDSRVHSAFVPRTSYQRNSSKLILTWNTRNSWKQAMQPFLFCWKWHFAAFHHCFRRRKNFLSGFKKLGYFLFK